MRISDWSSDVCSSDLPADPGVEVDHGAFPVQLILAARDPHVPFQRRCPLQGIIDAFATVSDLLRRGDDHVPVGVDLAQLGAALRRLPEPGGKGVGADLLVLAGRRRVAARSEEHTSELQSLMRISYAVFCLQK